MQTTNLRKCSSWVEAKETCIRLTTRAQARGTNQREPRSGTEAAIPRCLQRFVRHFGGLIAEHDIPATSLLHRRQSVDIAGEEPTAIGLFAVYSDTMSGELRRFPAGALGHGQRIPAARVSDFADNHDFFQLADTTYPHPLVGGRKGGRESIPTK